MDVKPVKTKKDYNDAMKRIETLMTAKSGTPEGDELDVLVTLVEAYEAKHYPIDAPDPVEAIRHRMEALGLERKDLEPILGSRSRVSEILNRKRKLSIDMIRKAHDSLGIPAGTLIQDYEVEG